MQKNILIFTGIVFLLEFYVFQAFKAVFDKPAAKNGYWIVTLAAYAFLVFLILTFDRSDGDHHRVHIIASGFLIFVLPKILVIFFLLFEDIIRVFEFLFGYFKSSGSQHFPERRKFLSVLALGTFGLMAGLFTDGIIFGKYRHRVRKVKLKIPGLPRSFTGYKIIQISDLHSGSFRNPERLQHAFDLINEQNADLVVFTGDLVNNYAEEFKPFIKMFSEIQAKDGKFSVLGNHDYGQYSRWESEEAKKQNTPNLIKFKKQAGFETLLNEHRIIEKNGEQIYLLGVENWGVPPFPQYGDLNKAAQGIPTDAVKILMSHDPTHFDEVVKKHPSNIQLTLSGHTHGMQLGVDLKNARWSPVQYRYGKWADLYESMGKYLYVNRGFGVIGYPGRVGVFPEITLIELA